MVRRTIDNELKKLLEGDDIVELVDESGKLIGRFLPQIEGFPEGWEPVTPEYTDEELQKLSEYDGPGLTTEELLARLRGKQ